MGLDISIVKLFMPTEDLLKQVIEKTYGDYYLLNVKDHPELLIFKNYIVLAPVERIDIEGTFIQRCLNLSDYVNKGVLSVDGIAYFNFEKISDKTTLKIPYNDILLKTEVEECLIEKSIGYQRKGANYKFYEDDMWNLPIVADYKTLLHHWDIYFSETASDRQNFKENIVDKFIEGETFVWYG